MLKDDIELLSGRIIEGPLTPVLFMLLKDTKDMSSLCADLNIKRGEEFDNPHRAIAESGPLASGGLSLTEWLANNAQPISL